MGKRPPAPSPATATPAGIETSGRRPRPAGPPPRRRPPAAVRPAAAAARHLREQEPLMSQPIPGTPATPVDLPVPAGAAGQLAAEVETLAARATAGAQRTAAVGAPATAATATPAGPERRRLLAANAAAMDFFAGQYPTSWAPAYLQRPIGTSLLGADPHHADPR